MYLLPIFHHLACKSSFYCKSGFGAVNCHSKLDIYTLLKQWTQIRYERVWLKVSIIEHSPSPVLYTSLVPVYYELRPPQIGKLHMHKSDGIESHEFLNRKRVPTDSKLLCLKANQEKNQLHLYLIKVTATIRQYPTVIPLQH